MLGGLDGLVVGVGSNLSALERSASRDAKYIDRTAHCKAIAPLTGLVTVTIVYSLLPTYNLYFLIKISV